MDFSGKVSHFAVIALSQLQIIYLPVGGIRKEGNVFVVDCDIRINTPSLRCGGVRSLTTEVEIKQ